MVDVSLIAQIIVPKLKPWDSIAYVSFNFQEYTEFKNLKLKYEGDCSWVTGKWQEGIGIGFGVRSCNHNISVPPKSSKQNDNKIRRRFHRHYNTQTT